VVLRHNGPCGLEELRLSISYVSGAAFFRALALTPLFNRTQERVDTVRLSHFVEPFIV
jgi:hypothetical protein